MESVLINLYNISMEIKEKTVKNSGFLQGWGLIILMVIGVIAVLVAAKLIFNL